MFGKKHNSVTSGLSVAALALLAACPAEAQFNNGFNPFSMAPRALQPLGNGPLLSFGNGFNNSFNNGIGNGFTNSFGTGFTNNFPTTFGNSFNSGAFNNSAFSTSAFNNGVSFANNNGSPFFTNQANGFTTVNGLAPAPTNGFNQPVAQFDPFTGTIQTVDPGLFFQANPSFSPFAVNGSVNGNFATNSFNNGFNNGQVVPQRIFRDAPAYNPTIPNRPASRYPQVATAAELQAIASSNGLVTQSQLNFMRPNWPSPYMDAMGNQAVRRFNTANGTGTVGTVSTQQAMPLRPDWPSPFMDSTRATPQNMIIRSGSAFGSAPAAMASRMGFPAPVINGPKVLFGAGGIGQASGAIVGPRMGFPAPVINGPKVLFGGGTTGSGAVVFGGRGR